ncbi:hypothetical protein AI2716V1_1059, partial [Enterobacter cloacae]|jgi:hypothetical protein
VGSATLTWGPFTVYTSQLLTPDGRYDGKNGDIIAAFALTMLLAGCSTEVTEYRQQQPKLDIFTYFQGKTEAWGMVQDRSGKQIRRVAADRYEGTAGDIEGVTVATVTLFFTRKA